MDSEIPWWQNRFRSACGRRDLDQLAGRHLLRRLAVWVERCACVIAFIGLVLTGLAAVPMVEAIEHASGRDDPPITAVTTAVAVADARSTVAYLSVPVAWTDPHGLVHRGKVPVQNAVRVGTPVRARLATDGTVHSASVTALGLWATQALACGALGLGAASIVGLGAHLVRGLTDGLRHESWEMAWSQLQPPAMNLGEG